MFRYAHKEYLNLLYLIPVLILFMLYVYRQKRAALNKLASPGLRELLNAESSRLKYILKGVLLVFAVLLLIVALANPQIGTGYKEIRQAGIDMYILLDVSSSMRAEDIKPNRLEAAKHVISNLIEKLGGDRIGLVVFSGDAYVQFPLTTDYAAAEMILSSVGFNTVPQPGTAIAQAVELAAGSFRKDVNAQKVIVIVSDGEDHEGNIVDAVKDAADKGIKIYTAGIGTPEGAPIPVYDARGNQTGFKTDGSGNSVVTKLNQQALQELASYGKAKYFGTLAFENQLEAVYRDIAKLDKTEYGTTRVIDYEDRYYYFLIPGLLMLILEMFLSDSKFRGFTALKRFLSGKK